MVPRVIEGLNRGPRGIRLVTPLYGIRTVFCFQYVLDVNLTLMLEKGELREQNNHDMRNARSEDRKWRQTERTTCGCGRGGPY